VLLAAAPKLMKALALIGTVAMFMVGGGILTHGWPAVHDAIASIAQSAAAIPAIGGALQLLLPSVLDAVAGVAAGALALALVSAANRVWRFFKPGGAPG
jgi:predicted DNA repair protein MutK